MRLLEKIDMGFRKLIEGTRKDYLDNVFLSLSSLGSPVFALILMSATLMSGKGLLFPVAIFICWAIVYPVKYLTSRQRPIDPVLRTEITSSFPSAHSANAFMTAVALSSYFPHLSALFFLTAIAVSLSRIYLRAHYLSDVLSGTLIGLLSGELAIILVNGLKLGI